MGNSNTSESKSPETITRRVLKVRRDYAERDCMGRVRPKWQGELFRDAIWLLAQANEYRYMFLSDINWAIIPPYRLNQYKVFYQSDSPFASVCWARVNDQVLLRLMKIGPRIRPREWCCGEHIVVMGIVAPFGGQDQVRHDIEQVLFHGKTIYWVREWVGSDANAKG